MANPVCHRTGELWYCSCRSLCRDVILPLDLWSDVPEHLQSLGEPVSLQFYHINMEKCWLPSNRSGDNI